MSTLDRLLRLVGVAGPPHDIATGLQHDCCVLVTDVVGYSKQPQEVQLVTIEHVLDVWGQHAATGHLRNGVLLPTGDGFIVILPAPTNQSPGVYWLLEYIVKANERARSATTPYQLRFGLHFGPCHPVRIVNGAMSRNTPYNNYLGYTVNYAARLSSCANPRQVIASAQVLERMESERATCESKLLVWHDSFLAAFKGDRIVYGSATRDVFVLPSMQASRPLADDSRKVYRLVGWHPDLADPEEPAFGSSATPARAVCALGINNYHADDAVDRSSFQLAPDIELFHLYRNEERPATVSTPPFFARLPFAVLFAPRQESSPGAMDLRTEDEETNVEWQIDTAWVPGSFGLDPEKNRDLCSLTSLALDKTGSQLRMTYARCTYFQSLASLISPDRVAQPGQRSLRHLLLDEGEGGEFSLPQLGSPRVTAHMGASAVVITQDGYPVIQHRGKHRLHSNVDSLSPSASGMVAWADFSEREQPLVLPEKGGPPRVYQAADLRLLFPGRENGKLLPTDRAVLREASEEIALFPDDVRAVTLVGIAREYRRVGKPEFFYVIRTQLTLNEVLEGAKNARDAFEYTLLSKANLRALPGTPRQRAFYFGELIADERFNDIARIAFLFASGLAHGTARPLAD